MNGKSPFLRENLDLQYIMMCGHRASEVQLGDFHSGVVPATKTPQPLNINDWPIPFRCCDVADVNNIWFLW